MEDLMPQSAPLVPAKSVVAYFEAVDRPRRDYFAMDLATLRQRYLDEFVWGAGPAEGVARVDELQISDVPGRLYRPIGGETCLLIWFHGGGWNLGSVECHEGLARALANRAGCAVLSVDYRLAPEHRYPAAVDDAWRATKWAVENFDQVAVGGDSAGGTIAAAVALRARDDGIDLALQVLVYPVLDYRVDHPSYDAFTRRYAGFAGQSEFGRVFQDTIRDIWNQYIPNSARRGETDASPLRADSVRGVAPLLMITAEHDILRPEEEEYVQRLAEAAIPARVVQYAGQIHGFFPLLAVMTEARLAVEEVGSALRSAFHPAALS